MDVDVNHNPDMTMDMRFALATELEGTSCGELGGTLVRSAALRHPASDPTA